MAGTFRPENNGPAEGLDFASLIAPISPDEFFKSHWEKAPLYVHSSDPKRFARLFSTAEIDGFLSGYGRPYTLGVRLSKHESGRTEIVDLAAAPNAAVDVDKIFAAYANGFTVNLNDLNERHAPARDLAISLSNTFEGMVKVNAYLTPAGSCAFPLHFDTHDVLIVQIEGSKSWRVHPPLFPLPTKSHKPPTVLENDISGAPFMTATLDAGDILYVPRGFGHQASTQQQASLHLTVGLHTSTVYDLVEASLHILGWDLAQLRRSIRPGMLSAKPPTAETREDLQTIRELLAQRLPLEEGLGVLAARELASRPAAPSIRFAAIEPAVIRALHAGSSVRRRPQTPCRVVEGCGLISIQYPSHSFNAPPRMAPALEHIARSEEFVISSLPGHLSDEEKVSLVQELISEGLLVPISSAP